MLRTAEKASESPFKRPRTIGLVVSTARALIAAKGTVRTPVFILVSSEQFRIDCSIG